jgi:hypothetical protein
MLARFIEWWVRNAAYLGPIATSISALAALWSVRMVTKTFRQNRADRLEELEAKRPKFRMKEGRVTASLPAPYQLKVVLNNIKPNPAAYPKLKVQIFEQGLYLPKVESSRALMDEIHEGESFDFSVALNELKLEEAYYVRLRIECLDARTHREYLQVIHRRFRVVPNNSEFQLEEVDLDEIRSINEARDKDFYRFWGEARNELIALKSKWSEQMKPPDS